MKFPRSDSSSLCSMESHWTATKLALIHLHHYKVSGNYFSFNCCLPSARQLELKWLHYKCNISHLKRKGIVLVSRPGHIYSQLLYCNILLKELPIVEQRRLLALWTRFRWKCHWFIKRTAVNRLSLVPFEFLAHWRLFGKWSPTCRRHSYVFRWSIKCYYLKQALYGLLKRYP